MSSNPEFSNHVMCLDQYHHPDQHKTLEQKKKKNKIKIELQNPKTERKKEQKNQTKKRRMRIDSISSPSQIWDICVTSTWKYEARPETIASKTIELCSSGSRNRDGSESAIRTIQFSSSFDGDDGFKSLETSDLPTALRPPKTVQILGFVRLSFEPSSIDISYVTAERERERNLFVFGCYIGAETGKTIRLRFWGKLPLTPLSVSKL